MKLHAVIVVPKGATHAPILLTRTPYNASKAPKANIAPVTVFETGTMTWRKQRTWPAPGAPRALYLGDNGHASFDAPRAAGFDEYVSDPQKPVPYLPRPVKDDHDQWRKWLVVDQRFVVVRPDVLSFVTEPLERRRVCRSRARTPGRAKRDSARQNMNG